MDKNASPTRMVRLLLSFMGKITSPLILLGSRCSYHTLKWGNLQGGKAIKWLMIATPLVLLNVDCLYDRILLQTTGGKHGYT